MMKAVIYFLVLATVYCVFYVLNHRTKRPEGCENLRQECESCRMVSCPANGVYEGGKRNA
ncbi:MAG: hypothetical protein IJJ30_02715 [Erysipelotrichaceae bacterium]|nr:hypothetical protein [Erysipelotrichaceae bacterium]MBR2551546.1 hypothetical protein [Erysipelotrichaceae bacterium]